MTATVPNAEKTLGKIGKYSQGPANDREILAGIAHRAMIERGLEPDFPPDALQQLLAIQEAAVATIDLKDLRDRPWASIDNDDSLDLDQITVAESLENGRMRVLVAIADVDALVQRDSAIDGHAARNTTSVYTPSLVFPMLPTALSTNLTSLNEDQDRVAVVTDMVFEADGSLAYSEHYRALVRNRAKLAYRSLGAWLAGESSIPDQIPKVPGLATNLRLQDGVAQRLVGLRQTRGALSLETIEPRAIFKGDSIAGLEPDWKNRATQLIEEFMVAANGASATYLASRKFPSIRRVLRSPERWERIVALAGGFNERLPEKPDVVALEAFLERRRKAAPDQFPDLSLAVVKLIGRGEYDLDLPGGVPPGHFALAVRDYTHSTAPNRRFPDLLTQRLLKAAISGATLPYTISELGELAKRCTDREDDATKVERHLRKSAAALLLSGRIGESFDAIVTGASNKGTWVRIFQPPTEGRVDIGFQGLDVGDRVQVKLLHIDVERGFIDFERPIIKSAP